jgi:hypothetical protein
MAGPTVDKTQISLNQMEKVEEPPDPRRFELHDATRLPEQFSYLTNVVDSRVYAGTCKYNCPHRLHVVAERPTEWLHHS